MGALALLLSSARPAPADSPSPTAAGFAVSVVGLLASNRYAAAWRSLVGAERHVVPRGLYVSCEQLTPVPGRVLDVRATGIRPASVAVPGMRRRLRGFVVDLRTTIGGLPGGTTVVEQLAFDVVGVRRPFAWALHADRFEDYRRGECAHGAASA